MFGFQALPSVLLSAEVDIFIYSFRKKSQFPSYNCNLEVDMNAIPLMWHEQYTPLDSLLVSQ